MHGRSHAESREIVEQKAKGRVRFSQLQCWFRRFREGPRLCPNSVDTPPPNNPTGKPIRPRDQLSQPASHQREAYQLSALSAGLAPLTGRLPARGCKPTIRLCEDVKRYINQRAPRADHRCRQAPHQKRFAFISECMSRFFLGIRTRKGRTEVSGRTPIVRELLRIRPSSTLLPWPCEG